MARRYIKIAAPDGANTINLSGLKLPDPYPEIKPNQGIKEYQMRNTVSGRGNRVFKSRGTNVNHSEISFVAHFLTSSEYTNLQNFSKASPAVVLFSNDSGTTRYFCIFEDDGFIPLGYNNNESPSGTAYFWKAEIKLKILQSTTQSFGG